MRYIVRKVVMDLDTDNPYNDLEQAVAAYGHGIQSLAYIYLKNRADAEDIAQEVFLAYYRRSFGFSSAGKEKAWLMTVTANKCKSLLRAKHRQELPLTEDIPYLPKEENAVLLAVMALDEKYRLPIHLHYYEGYSLQEIGKILKASPGTVGSWLTRGREKLKSILKEEEIYG